MTINLNTQENCKLLLFPDNQPHVTIEEEDFYANVVCSLTDCNKLIQLGMVKEALDRNGTDCWLDIPYLMGARYDRVMEKLGSFDLKVIANIINSYKFDGVNLYDPHSDVAPALINKSHVITNKILVDAYDKKDAVLIIPDAGAAKKSTKYREWNKNITGEIYCIKHRDTKTGNIELQVVDVDKLLDRHCVIIDDICDGGATFVAISKQIHEARCFPKSMTLIVTHGIFSKGFSELGEYFSEIITSNSRFQTYNSNIVKVINYEF